MIRGRRPVLGVVALITVLASGAVAGCGLPRDAEARAIPAVDEPFPMTATTMSAEPAAEGGSVEVWFMGPERLEVANRPGPFTLTAALEQLVAGPNQSDLDRGLQTRIPSGTTVRSVAGPDAAGVVSVDLSPEFIQVRGDAQTAAVAQVVFTLTESPLVRSVRFLIDGAPQAVPTDDGTTTDPVDREDYERFGPPPAPPTTLPPPPAPPTSRAR